MAFMMSLQAISDHQISYLMISTILLLEWTLKASGLFEADSMFLIEMGASAVAKYIHFVWRETLGDWTLSKMRCLYLCGHVEADFGLW